MSGKLNALSKFTALFAGLAMVHGFSTAAEAAQADDSVSPEIISAMQRDLGLSEAQVKRRLAFEAAAPRIESALKAELGNRFGGAWLNQDGSQLIVGVTNPADAALVRSAGAEPRMVSHTLERLNQVKAELDRNMQSAGPDIHSWYVDVSNNTVVVQASESALFTPGVANFVALAGRDSGLIQLVPSAEAPQTFYNLVGGQAYYINGSSRCSIGFSVYGGFVTAGHCGYTGASTTGYNSVAQGSFAGSSFPGNDYAWVRTNSSWTPTSTINGTTARVYGSSVAPVGSSVCRSGSTTGWRCGSIQALNSTVNYAQGAVYGLTRTSACAEPGDSGGSFITGNQAQGVTSGGSGNCSTGGTTYFQPVNEILSVYGLTLVTG
jgi:streptogrisin C